MLPVLFTGKTNFAHVVITLEANETTDSGIKMTAVMNTYGRLPVAFTRGKGAWLYDENDDAYLDALGGIAVCGLGHCHPDVSEAITRQANTLMHTSNLFTIPAQENLAKALSEASGMENMFFSNSGAEANECALKIARKYGNDKGIELPTVIVTESAFHGRTMATLSATGSEKVHAGFAPLVSGFERVPYNDLEAIKAVIARNPSVVAIMAEPIQGEAGIILPDSGYVAALRAICDEHDLLLILDEIQTGIGRTGKFFAFQHAGIKPDVVTSAKSLGNGVPIGACLTSGKATNVLQPGNHGSTFGGNPLACAAANVVVGHVAKPEMLARISELGERILSGLEAALKDSNRASNFRGQGQMMAFDVAPQYQGLMLEGLKQRVVLNVTGNNSIRLLPPYTLSDEEADQLIERVAKTVLEAPAAE